MLDAGELCCAIRHSAGVRGELEIDRSTTIHGKEAGATDFGALGDVLATAEVYVRLLPPPTRCQHRHRRPGPCISTKAKHFVKKQKEQGW